MKKQLTYAIALMIVPSWVLCLIAHYGPSWMIDPCIITGVVAGICGLVLAIRTLNEY